jgi:Gas vesicle synthesis protein GvpO
MAESKQSRSSPQDIATRAIEQMQELTGRHVEGVTGLARDGEEWTVTVEVLELQRVPTTTDVLGKYEVTLDKDGDLTGIERTRRYPRAEAGEV